MLCSVERPLRKPVWKQEILPCTSTQRRRRRMRSMSLQTMEVSEMGR